MGGDCIGSDLVPLSTGYDYMKMVVDVADNREPDFTINNHYQSSHIRFFLINNDIEKYNNIKDKYRIIEYTVKDEMLDAVVTNSTDRHGYYIYVEE